MPENPPSSNQPASVATSRSDLTSSNLQQLLNELSVEFISILDLDELIERVARRVKEVIDYKFFNLLLVDESRGGLVWKKSIGYPPEEVARHELIPLGSEHRLGSRSHWSHDHRRRSPDRLAQLPGAGQGGEEPRSEIAVPLILVREQRVVGVLTIESAEPNYFTGSRAADQRPQQSARDRSRTRAAL